MSGLMGVDNSSLIIHCEVCGPIKESIMQIHLKSVSHLIKSKKSSSEVKTVDSQLTKQIQQVDNQNMDDNFKAENLDFEFKIPTRSINTDGFFDNPLKKFEKDSASFIYENQEKNDESIEHNNVLEDDNYKINQADEEAYLKEKMLEYESNINELDYYEAVTQLKLANEKSKGDNLLNKKRIYEIKFDSNPEEPQSLSQFLDDLI